jgi:EpsG family
MWPYFLIPLLALLPTLNERPNTAKNFRHPRLGLMWYFIALLMVFQIGWRYEVGGDWLIYLDQVESATNESFARTLTSNDPAYGILIWLGAHIWGGIYLPNMVSAILFVYGLMRFCSYLPRPWLALSMAIPYLVMVVAMGYTRQSVAIGFAMLAMVALIYKSNFWRFLAWIAIAATFHKSAVILVPLGLALGTKRPWLKWIGVCLAAPLLFVLLLQESVDNLIHGYIDLEYSSSGAGIRVAMNAIPAAIFLFYKNHFIVTEKQHKFWLWLSISALGFVALLEVSPSSTAVDRLALYWIPLQLFVWPQLPDILGKIGRKNSIWVTMVFSYGLLVMTGWLFFAQTAFAWIPYQFYPWVLFWS